MQVGAVGQRLDVVFLNLDGSAQDVGGADEVWVYLVRPDLSEVALAGSFDSDGSDGAVYCETEADTLTVAGRYSVLGYVVTTDAGFTGFSPRYQYDVGPAPTVQP